MYSFVTSFLNMLFALSLLLVSACDQTSNKKKEIDGQPLEIVPEVTPSHVSNSAKSITFSLSGSIFRGAEGLCQGAEYVLDLMNYTLKVDACKTIKGPRYKDTIKVSEKQLEQVHKILDQLKFDLEIPTPKRDVFPDRLKIVKKTGETTIYRTDAIGPWSSSTPENIIINFAEILKQIRALFSIP
jgi:hypothetical protein